HAEVTLAPGVRLLHAADQGQCRQQSRSQKPLHLSVPFFCSAVPLFRCSVASSHSLKPQREASVRGNTLAFPMNALPATHCSPFPASFSRGALDSSDQLRLFRKIAFFPQGTWELSRGLRSCRPCSRRLAVPPAWFVRVRKQR